MTFDQWWVTEYGHPPDSAEERRAFARALARWKKESASEDALSQVQEGRPG